MTRADNVVMLNKKQLIFNLKLNDYIYTHNL